MTSSVKTSSSVEIDNTYYVYTSCTLKAAKQTRAKTIGDWSFQKYSRLYLKAFNSCFNNLLLANCKN